LQVKQGYEHRFGLREASAPGYSFSVTSVFAITAGYLFVPIPETSLDTVHDELVAFGEARGMRGLTLIAPEGINGTVCGSPEAITEWKAMLADRFGPMEFKDSTAGRQVFAHWSVRKKSEIVALKQQGVSPMGKRNHLSPAQWNEMLEREDVVVLDTRNAYEVALGKFEGAIDPGINAFHELPAAVQQGIVPKGKKVMMYCTGGIRCEKALIALQNEGYDDVYQLDGGILAYLEQFPDGAFKGECFVFDRRVAVDAHLKPTEVYAICPHCGLPGTERITCTECSHEQKICTKCAVHAHRNTCSKRCANEALETVMA
jgi:UPF0176 protein